MAQCGGFITRANGEATFINHTFMVILSDKLDVSSVDANILNASAPTATGVPMPSRQVYRGISLHYFVLQ